MYHLYAENVAVIVRRTIINDFIFRIMENVLLETRYGRWLPGAFKPVTACSEAVHQGFIEESFSEALVHFHFVESDKSRQGIKNPLTRIRFFACSYDINIL